MDKYKILTKDFTELDDDQIEKFLDYEEKTHVSHKRDDVLRSRKYRKKRLAVPPNENETREIQFVFLKNSIIGMSFTGFEMSENEQNPDKIWIQMEVLPEYRGEGIGKDLLKNALDFARKHNKSKIETGVYPVDGKEAIQWLKKLGFKKGMSEKISRLYKDEINWEFIEETENKVGKRLEEQYRFERFTKKQWADSMISDDELANEMADFYTEAERLLPWEDIDQNDRIVTREDIKRYANHNMKTLHISESISYYVFDGDKIIGMSGTYYPNDPPVKDVGTGLTAVREAYHRQGIATYLKIKIIRDYTRTHSDFKYIYTENAASNKGMLAINQSLGFRPVEDWQMWQGNIDDLKLR